MGGAVDGGEESTTLAVRGRTVLATTIDEQDPSIACREEQYKL